MLYLYQIASLGNHVCNMNVDISIFPFSFCIVCIYKRVMHDDVKFCIHVNSIPLTFLDIQHDSSIFSNKCKGMNG